ncbi:hypothetical protein [Vibrio alginolyticus]|uniref:hypothetical protein n=1 Tax=Vibrio alginolyticus TaxID=663 RepID=UPI00211A1282|nr:hypothetical protein [Vibrio alginolyticus]MCQ9070510.1 hypothetical protein [Vibrio alginolyticus]
MVKTIPAQLMITDVSITNYHRVYSTESMSGIRYSRDSGIQWFKGTITLQAYGYDNVRMLNGFLASLKGKLNAFALPLGGAYSNPDILTNPVTSTEHSIGASSIQLFHTGRAIEAGSVFTVLNDTKLYTVLEQVGEGGTYAINPSLKTSHAQTEPVNFMNPVITAVLDSNETTIEHQGNGQLASATISWTEYLT